MNREAIRAAAERRLEFRNAKNSASKLKIILPKYADETRHSWLNIVYHIRPETVCDGWGGGSTLLCR